MFSLYNLKAQSSDSFVSFSGSIINHESKEVSIYNRSKYKKVFILNEDGSFSDTLKIKRGDYTFKCGNEVTQIFLAPGYDINISLDTKEFDESVVYKGVGAQNNNFLAKIFLYNEQNSLDYSEIKKLSGEDHYEYIMELYEGKDELLNSMILKDHEFVQDQKSNNHLEILYQLLNHNKIELFIENNLTSTVSSYIAKEFKIINLNDSISFKKNGIYKYLVLSYFNYGLIANNTIVKDHFKNIKPLIRNAVVNNLGRGISIKKPDYELYYKTLKLICSDTALMNSYTLKYNQILKLKPGYPSPSFTCNDINGQAISLSDFKGKLVYIDLWATWCGPCKAQIPFLNELEEKYKEKNISFISISIDKLADLDKWKKMIEIKEMGGIQLIAENAWESEFAVAYNVRSIPRFILIDQQGNIINVDAPRPSTSGIDINTGEKIKGKLNTELIQLIDIHLK